MRDRKERAGNREQKGVRRVRWNGKGTRLLAGGASGAGMQPGRAGLRGAREAGGSRGEPGYLLARRALGLPPRVPAAHGRGARLRSRRVAAAPSDSRRGPGAEATRAGPAPGPSPHHPGPSFPPFSARLIPREAPRSAASPPPFPAAASPGGTRRGGAGGEGPGGTSPRRPGAGLGVPGGVLASRGRGRQGESGGEGEKAGGEGGLTGGGGCSLYMGKYGLSGWCASERCVCVCVCMRAAEPAICFRQFVLQRGATRAEYRAAPAAGGVGRRDGSPQALAGVWNGKVLGRGC